MNKYTTNSILILIILQCIYLPTAAFSQSKKFYYANGKTEKNLINIAVSTTSGDLSSSKLLYANDSILILWPKGVQFSSDIFQDTAIILSYREIDKITLYNKANIGIITSVSLIGGSIIGLVAGSSYPDDGFRDATIQVSGIGGAVLGLLTGITSYFALKMKDEYVINGHLPTFQAINPSLINAAIFPAHTTTFNREDPLFTPHLQWSIGYLQNKKNIVPSSKSPKLKLLNYSRFHITPYGAYSFTTADNKIMNAISISGLAEDEPRGWFDFDFTKYPYNNSIPYFAGIRVAYSITPKFQLGLDRARLPKIDILGTKGNRESAQRSATSILFNYVHSPIRKLLERRIQTSLGVGISHYSFNLNSVVHDENRKEHVYTISKNLIGGQISGTMHYFLTKWISIHTMIDYRYMPKIIVPKQTFEGVELIEHRLNFSSLNISLGLTGHF